MQKFIQPYLAYILCLIAYFVVIGILLLQIEYGDAILFFSEQRSKFGDVFFTYGTKITEEIAFAILTISFLIARKFRFALLMPVIGFFVSGVSYLLKSLFKQARPFKYFQEQGTTEMLNLVEGIHLHTGNNSFPSGHTMAGFALFTYIALYFPNRPWLQALCFFCALEVAISRVYLIQHFLVDVYVGAAFGILIGIGFHHLRKWLESRSQPSA